MSEFDQRMKGKTTSASLAPPGEKTVRSQSAKCERLDQVREGKVFLRLGTEGAGVNDLQEKLNSHYGQEVIAPSGVFCAKTKEIVLQFQKEKGLKADGVVGRNTLAALESGKLALPSWQSVREWVGEKSTQIADRATFRVGLEFVFSWEGGYTADKRDRGNRDGGATNMGITQGTLNYWCKKHDLAPQKVADLTKATASRIYEELYWKDAKCDLLPKKLAFVHFDTAVNMGVAGAACILQRALGVKVDGVIGRETLQALKNSDPEKILGDYFELRSELYQKLATKGQNSKFLAGWGNRLSDLRQTVDTLSSKGELAAISRPKPDLGVIGFQTQDAIKEFQKESGLKDDGILGPETIQRLLGT